MKAATVIGFVLILLGMLSLAYPRLMLTERETLYDTGTVQAERETTRSIPISPLIGAAAIISGLALVIVGTRKVG
jgi:hypothetical protein